MTAYDNPFIATLAGAKNTFIRGTPFGSLTEGMRFDGGIALVTGASAGLGFAIATELARRGGTVYGAARTATDEVTRSLRQASGSSNVHMLPVDLADIRQIDALVDTLAARVDHLDLLVCNAALVPKASRETQQGLEQMFAVNYLAKHLLVKRLRERGLFKTDGARLPRIVIVSSEAHRGAQEMPMDPLGAYVPFGIGEVLKRYGTYKLALTTFAAELSRQLEGQDIAVHAVCPGAVNSQVAREAPAWSQPLIKVMFTLFFQSPSKAAKPVLYLCLAPQIEGETGHYLHQWVKKAPDERTTDPVRGQAQWQATEALLDRLAKQE